MINTRNMTIGLNKNGRGIKRALEVNNTANIIASENEKPHKKRAMGLNRRCISSLAVQAYTYAPEERTIPSASIATDFDKARAKQLPGVYMPPEYIGDIIENLNEDESNELYADYFEHQPDLSPRMRTILYAWLTEVAMKFETKEIVIWTTFDLIDRYLETTVVERENIQLLGCACLWIASKYHEIYPQTCDDLVHMADGAFDKSMLLAMEADVCDKLDYALTQKNSFHYLQRFTDIAIHGLSTKAHKEYDEHMATDPRSSKVSAVVKMAKRVKNLARYGMERYNLDAKSILRPAKQMAAMALFTALSLTGMKWTTQLVEATGYTNEQMRSETFIGGSYKEHKKILLDFSNTKHNVVIRKYELPECGSVSTLRKKKQKRAL